MLERADDIAPRALTVEAFGVRVRMATEGAVRLEELVAALPPGARPCPESGIATSFMVGREADGAYELRRDGESFAVKLARHAVVDVLGRELRMLLALEAPRRIFIHAGAVAHRGRAIIIPGSSFSGKSTLVAALVRSGALYYSDEFAVLDDRGLVHPFPKPLSIRENGVVQIDRSAEDMGGRPGEAAVPLGTVAITTYNPGAEWRPRRISQGEATLAVLSHAVAAQTRSAEALRVITSSLEDAVALKGERGDADRVAALLLSDPAPQPSR